MATESFPFVTFRVRTNNNRKCLNGRVAVYLRKRGYVKTKKKMSFWRHTIGIGGSYIWIEEDHVRVRASDLGFNKKITDLVVLRKYLDLIDRMESVLEETAKAKLSGRLRFGKECGK
jgi:hypothetical protein